MRTHHTSLERYEGCMINLLPILNLIYVLPRYLHFSIEDTVHTIKNV